MMYSNLRSQVLPRLIPPHCSILAAVSGGPDSVALAHVIWRYINENPDQNIKLVISHINHKVRAEAEEEARLVSSLAQKWNVPFILHEFDAKQNARLNKKSFQEASREWRYACWREDQELYGCTKLATGHHLGDQAETVLYRVIRGSGTTGLAGIYPEKDQIIRPLLGITKQEIMDYCHQEGLPYALDKSNQDVCYDRNRIRLELLPMLERDYNNLIQEALARMAELARWDEEYIESQVEGVWSLYCKHIDRSQIAISLDVWNQPEAILSRVLRKGASMLREEQRGLEYKYIKTIMEKGKRIGWRQDLPGLHIETSKDGFLFLRRIIDKNKPVADNKENLAKNHMEKAVELPINVWVDLPELELKAGIFTEKKNDIDILWTAEFDRGKVLNLQQPLLCRTRKSGDRIFLKNIGHKVVKKVFQEKGVTIEERQRLPMFVSGDSVLWLPGICRSDLIVPSSLGSSLLYGVVAKK